MARLATPVEKDQYATDGFALLKGLLSHHELYGLEQAFNYTLAYPGPGAREFFPGEGGRFYQDGSNRANWDYYANRLRGHPLPDVCRSLWNASDVWFMNEQVFLKEGPKTRRTPWHQDASYTPYDGRQLAIMWVNFDPVPRDFSLEFVRGSHLGPLYSGSAFDALDDTLPMTAGTVLPRIPNIEQTRDAWDIVSFPVEPGDVIVFHNRTLHGGAATEAGGRRRTLSLRFFGADVTRVARSDDTDQGAESQLDSSLMSGWSGLVKCLRPGQPLSDQPAFRLL